ncbi:hypothetical protein AB1Y20_011582 [Prymnesium parvum]|uniref:Autophagy-related protein 9 n=1 Tax=Prymnesium parvum TaxID=97485 RepID=A0AB34IK72_PRYPA
MAGGTRGATCHVLYTTLTPERLGGFTMLREFFLSRRTARLAWGGALLLVALSVTRAALEAAIVGWYGSFYNTLQSAASAASAPAAAAGRAAVGDGLLRFAAIGAPWAVLAPLGALVRRHFCFGWRMALTEAYVGAWAACALAAPEGASQRVQEDTARFSAGVELLAGKVLDGVLRLYIFLPKLLAFGETFHAPSFVPLGQLMGRAWLLYVAASIACVCWAVSAIIARPLVDLEVSNQRIEAAFRKQLVIDEDAPRDERSGGAKAASGGVAEPIAQLFLLLRRNYRALYCNLLLIEEWLEVSQQFVVIIPFALGSIQMFAAEAEERASLGDLMQLSSVFQSVFEVLSLPASSWADVQEFRSVVRRLCEFELAMPPGSGTNSGVGAVRGQSDDADERLL